MREGRTKVDDACSVVYSGAYGIASSARVPVTSQVKVFRAQYSFTSVGMFMRGGRGRPP
jgi:hypothetical protein